MILNTDLIYPIGAVYISINNTNPSKFFGGTWEQITGDAYLKIVTSNAGIYAGTSSEHKIPIESMPSHRHSSPTTYEYNTSGLKRTWNSGNSPMPEAWTGYAGGGQPYYPYYYGVYVFVRTA